MGRVMLLANPDSGSGRAQEVERQLRDCGADVVAHPIEGAAEAPVADAERIVVAGGDGSIGLAARLAARHSVPLAVVPVGTANDFARALDLPDDDLPAAARLAATGTRTRRFEIGLMDGEVDGARPFVNVASLGLPPAAAQHAHGLKRALGPLAYVVGALRAAAAARPVRCRIVDDEGASLYDGEVWQATIACSGRFGAGSQLDADPTDGLLDAVAVEAGSRVALARRARGMRTGTLEEQPAVHRRRAPAFAIELAGETDFNVDGELCVRTGEVRFKVAPERVDVIVG